MPDRSDEPEAELLDFLMMGGSIKAAAKRFGMSQPEVRGILADETTRYADASEIKQQWALASRRLLKMEIAFHQRAMEQMDPSAAVIALKANERRSTLAGGGSSQPSHLITLMANKTLEEEQDSPSSTFRLLASIRRLKGLPEEPEDEPPER
jgi:hypothetical protein